MTNSKGKITDNTSAILRPADQVGSGPVLLGNEQVANTWDDEDAVESDAVKGPDDAQWPVDTRGDSDTSNVEDGAEGMVKGPDPSQHPARSWADQLGTFDPGIPSED